MTQTICHVVTRTQAAYMTADVIDFTTPEMLEQHAKYFADLDEAEKRGGEFFATMGDIARERLEGKPK